MDVKDILTHVDHTILTRTAVWDDVKAILDDTIKYNAASACIQPCFVKQAKEYVGDKAKICTVIGFPNGYHTTDVKVYETKKAIEEGADEVDMVVNLCDVKAGLYDKVLEEIKALRAASEGKILKVIIETSELTDDEKIKLCEIVSVSGADYIKTSTGFTAKGATFEDVALFSEHVSNGLKIKAAGGISSLDDAERFLELGADRLGTSRIIKIVKGMEDTKDGNTSY